MDITYNIYLVIISAIIAVTAGYFTIEMAPEIIRNKGLESVIWLGITSVTMGIGIWGMHFVAMTAFSIGTDISYNFVIVLISLIAAILGCVQGLYIISKPIVNNLTLVASSISMGLAIAGMHYIGMSAMRVAAKINYNILLVILSVVIAIVVSLAAMKILIFLRIPEETNLYLKKKLTASLLMGGAVLSMHYTGMAAANFQIMPNMTIQTTNILNNEILGFFVGLAVVGIFGMVYSFYYSLD